MQIKWVPTTLCLYKEVDKKYTVCNLKTTELLNCVFIGVCAVIKSDSVYKFGSISKYIYVDKNIYKRDNASSHMYKNVIKHTNIYFPVLDVNLSI